MLLALVLTGLVLSGPLAAAAPSEAASRRYQQGVQFLRQQKWKAAVAAFQEALKLAPGAETYIGLGIELGALDDLEGSRDAFRQAVKLQPASPEAHYYLGLARKRSGDDKQAISELQVAVRLRPADEEALLALGLALQQAGEIDKAIGHYQAALRRNSKSAEAHRGLGLAWARTNCPTQHDAPPQIALFEDSIRQEKFQEVEPLLRTYLKEHPTSWWAYYALGYSLFGQKRISESIQALSKSLELNIQNGEAHKILGRGLTMIGRFDLAQVEFEQAARLKPESAEIHYNLGRVHSALDNFPPGGRPRRNGGLPASTR